jgi:glycosyltransferase involved in cell wall biosynthesis
VEKPKMKKITHLKKIRVAQIIDSLDAGGGERMAVNLANAFSKKIECSALLVTRKEGLLKSEISKKVTYIYIKKSKAIDFKAISLALKFITKHKISHLHAHSTSFFFATLLKCFKPQLKLVWHDHYGNRVNQSRVQFFLLKLCSKNINAIILVSNELKEWAELNLYSKIIKQINNFIILPKIFSEFKHHNKYVVMVANLRHPKNHFNLVKAFSQVANKLSGIDLILVGSISDTDYFESLKKLTYKLGLEHKVIFLGQKPDVYGIIKASSLAVISSDSEGLPLSLLEYAMAKKPVVVTDVGQCKTVVGDFAKVVPTSNSNALAEAMIYYLTFQDQAQQDANQLYEKVTKEYGADSITDEILDIYTGI